MDKDKIRITVTISTETRKRIEEKAKNQERSVSFVGGRALDRAFEPIQNTALKGKEGE